MSIEYKKKLVAVSPLYCDDCDSDFEYLSNWFDITGYYFVTSLTEALSCDYCDKAILETRTAV